METSPGGPLASPQPQRVFLHLGWTPDLGEMLSLLRSQGTRLYLAFAGGGGGFGILLGWAFQLSSNFALQSYQAAVRAQ